MPIFSSHAHHFPHAEKMSKKIKIIKLQISKSFDMHVPHATNF
jgi:hypothetical protein